MNEGGPARNRLGNERNFSKLRVHTLRQRRRKVRMVRVRGVVVCRSGAGLNALVACCECGSVVGHRVAIEVESKLTTDSEKSAESGKVEE